MIQFGLSLMPEPGFAAATLDLFEDGTIDVVEWSFDMGWHPGAIPPWLDGLLTDFGQTDALLGHGVSYSLLGASGSHDQWLAQLAVEVESRNYRWITEHVGFVGGGRFSFSAPLPMPATHDVIALGQARLTALAEAARCPVGIENLATCLGPADAKDQALLLTQLIAPVDGFLLLDLHNLYCQAHNTGIDPLKLLAHLPLDRVREVHLSGGSWSPTAGGGRLRRDTHDGLVPPAVLDLLGVALMRCENLEVVVYERMGSSFSNPETHEAYRRDVRTVAAITKSTPVRALSQPQDLTAVPLSPEGADLASYQASMLDVLNGDRTGGDIRARMAAEQPAWADRIAAFDSDLLEVGSALTKTWGRLQSP